jgi:hypothetical protein
MLLTARRKQVACKEMFHGTSDLTDTCEHFIELSDYIKRRVILEKLSD